MFLDFEISATGATFELLLKPNESLTPAAVHDFRDSIKLGDELEVGGSYEQGGSGTVFIVASIRTVSTWKSSHPHEHFVHRATRDEPELPGSDEGIRPCHTAQPSTSPQAYRDELTTTEHARAAIGGQERPAVLFLLLPACGINH